MMNINDINNRLINILDDITKELDKKKSKQEIKTNIHNLIKNASLYSLNYQVKCDEENNPPSTIIKGFINIEISWKDDYNMFHRIRSGEPSYVYN